MRRLTAVLALYLVWWPLFPMLHAQSVAPFTLPRQQFFDASGKPLAGGLIYTYAAGTTTPLATYTDSTGTVPNANPTVLDSGGFGTLWFKAAAYKVVMKNALGVQQWAQDNVTSSAFLFLGTSLAGVRIAGNFTGAECGAKIAAADSDFSSPKGIIVVDRTCGMNISSWPATGFYGSGSSPQHSIWFVEGGTWNVSATMTFKHGGITLQGVGMNDQSATPGTMLQWTGAAGQDLVSLDGTGGRLDTVVVNDIILDGGGVARFAARAEKIDRPSFNRVRFRNAVTANFYAVDSTGIHWSDVDLTQCAAYCSVLDWGTGGFAWDKGTMDVLFPMTQPAFLIQGASNSVSIQHVEHDASCTSTFVGFYKVDGIDVASGIAGAPAGGVGAPVAVRVRDSSFFMKAGCVAPSQGADILVAGTAAGNVPQKVIIDGVYFQGLAISPAAVKIDRGQHVKVKDVFSTQHVTSTIILTANAVVPEFEEVLSPTETVCTDGGTGQCGIRGDLSFDGVSGALVSAGGYKGFVYKSDTANISSGGKVRLAKSDTICFRNNANSADVCVALDGSDHIVITSGGNTWTMPAVTDQAVGRATTDTLTNKTLDSAVFTTLYTEQSANGAQVIHGQASELLTLSTSGTTTDTAANLLPANATIDSVVARVTTTITTATDWKLGDPTTAGRFSAANASMTAGTTQVGTVQVDQTGAAGPRQTSAAKVRVTTTGTPGAGVVRITVLYRQYVPPTS